MNPDQRVVASPLAPRKTSASVSLVHSVFDRFHFTSKTKYYIILNSIQLPFVKKSMSQTFQQRPSPLNPYPHLLLTRAFASDLEIGRTFRGPMDRALINGAPVAVPVTMQFALHRDAVYVSRACISLVCILRVAGQRERKRERGSTVEGEETMKTGGFRRSAIRRYLQPK